MAKEFIKIGKVKHSGLVRAGVDTIVIKPISVHLVGNADGRLNFICHVSVNI